MKLDSKCTKKFPRFLRKGFCKPKMSFISGKWNFRNFIQIHVPVFTQGTFFKERKFVTFARENWDVKEK